MSKMKTSDEILNAIERANTFREVGTMTAHLPHTTVGYIDASGNVVSKSAPEHKEQQLNPWDMMGKIAVEKYIAQLKRELGLDIRHPEA